MTEIRITVENLSPEGGTFLTPFWFGLHDQGFDLFEVGGEASEGLERIAEDGTFMAIADELIAADPEGQGGIVTGAAGPIATAETTSVNVDVVDGSATQYISLAAMLLPSNDAFVGTEEEIALFDEDGNFLGTQTVTFLGSDVLDAGTEVNTEMDAAFINQAMDDAGIEEGGVIAAHPGFNGSAGLPEPEFDQIILGGTNAFGEFIDPTVADFTLPGAAIAEITIQEVIVTEGGGEDDSLEISFGGLDRVDGGAGTDSVAVDTALSGLSVLRAGTGFRFVDANGDEVEIGNVEEIAFSDATLAVTTDAAAVAIALIYQTALGREADAGGLAFWTGELAGGQSIGAIADAFVNSAEFAAAGGDAADVDGLLDFVYDNAVGRGPDEAGEAFWTDRLSDDDFDAGDLVAAFAQADETADVNAEAIEDGFLILA
ncbi:MAG: spondin domain-containing protein [Pseudomonadota bacterium]